MSLHYPQVPVPLESAVVIFDLSESVQNSYHHKGRAISSLRGTWHVKLVRATHKEDTDIIAPNAKMKFLNCTEQLNSPHIWGYKCLQPKPINMIPTDQENLQKAKYKDSTKK